MSIRIALFVSFVFYIVLFSVVKYRRPTKNTKKILRRNIYSKGSKTAMLQSSNDHKNIGCSQIPVCSWRTIKNGKDIYPRGPQRAPSKFVSEVEKIFRHSCEHPKDLTAKVISQGGALHALVGGDFTMDNDIDMIEVPISKTCKCKYGGADALCRRDNSPFVIGYYGEMYWLPLPLAKRLEYKYSRIWVGPDKDTYIHWYGFMFDVNGTSGFKTNSQLIWTKKKCDRKGYGSVRWCSGVSQGGLPPFWHQWRQRSLSNLRFYDKNNNGHISFNEIIHQSITMGVDVDWILKTYQSDPCILYNAAVRADAFYRYLTKITHYIDSGFDMVQYGTKTTITLPLTTDKTICHNQSMETTVKSTIEGISET